MVIKDLGASGVSDVGSGLRVGEIFDWVAGDVCEDTGVYVGIGVNVGYGV